MITLTREEAQQVLDALTRVRWAAGERDKKNRVRDFDAAMDVSIEAIETLRARLSAPEPVPVTDKYLMEVECTKCGAKQDGVLTVTAPQQPEPPCKTGSQCVGGKCPQCVVSGPAGWIYEDDEGRMMFSQMPQNPPFWEPVYRVNLKEKHTCGD